MDGFDEVAGESAPAAPVIPNSIAQDSSTSVKSAGYMALHGARLLAQGYLPIPIHRGKKYPVGRKWEQRRMTLADVERDGAFGVGILCGQSEHPICAVDIDVVHPALAAPLTTWGRNNLPDVNVERVGLAPKIMFIGRAARAGLLKQTSAEFIDLANPTKPNGKPLIQRIEVLGAGQQFVAYNDHPDTGKPYEYLGLFDLTDIAAAELSVITQEQIDAVFAEFERLALQHGLVPHAKATSKQSESTSPPGDLESMAWATERQQAIDGAIEETFADLESALAYLDLTSREEWIKTGQNLACFKGIKWEARARELWENKASKAKTHDEKKDADKWDDLAGDRSDFRAIFARAQARGWANPRKGAARDSSLTASQIIDALRKKTREGVIATWAEATAKLPRDAAEEVVNEVHRLAGVKLRTLNGALQDAKKVIHQKNREADTQRRAAKRQIISYRPESRTAHAEELERLIVATSRPGECVSFGGLLAAVVEKQIPYTHLIDDEGIAPPAVPQIEPLDAVAVLAKIERVAAFSCFGDLIAVPPSIVEILLKKSTHIATRVTGLVTHPIVLPDGTILCQDGLHECTGLFLAGASMPQMRPYTQGEAIAAVARIADRLFGEFEFASPLDAAVAIAGLLTGVQRRLLDIAPGLAVFAAMQASGKTTLVRVIHILLTGRDMPVSTFPENDESEVQKRLLSMLLRSPALVCLDNMTDGTTFRSSAIAAVMTGPVLIQRVLGVSREVECPTNVLLAITGNNIALGSDELTRWMVCRLAPGSARPHERTFRNPDVVANVLRMREDVLRDVIGIVAGFLASGADVVKSGGSRFPRWDRMVRQPLLWAGACDVADVFQANVEGSEDVGACMGLLKVLRRMFGEAPFYASEVAEAANTGLMFPREGLSAERIGTRADREEHDLRTRLVTALESLRAKDVRSGRSVGRALRAVVGRPVMLEENGAEIEARLVDLHKLDGVARYKVLVKCV